ncbi:MAG: LysM peptidoglycan-binding protein [Ramlibacter sp.]|nr:LysM peptidoglycan-binding protein [Ramlibacter sp.]
MKKDYKMLELRGRRWMWAAGVLAASMLAGCASGSRRPAPVEDRSVGAHAPAAAGTANTGEAPKPPPGSENQGKPGYYTIRPGDTLIRIALDSGQNWRDIARWNNIDNPNVIEVGQVLRVIPPAGSTEVAVARPVVPGVVVPSGAAAPSASAPRAGSSAPQASLPPPANAPPPSAGEDDLAWTWPTAGAATVLAGFDEQRNKGLDIAGKAGDPVLATADGRVVYAGAGLRGYGNLIILKHNNTFLSAYAHNQTLLVKEDQSVRKGQKIAEMGSSDADRVKLHFEIRRQGKPVDPAKYLPPK